MTPRMSIVLDCSDPVALAGFWTQALGYEQAWHVEPYVALRGDGPVLLLQRVDEAKSQKNRCHFDLHVADAQAEAERMVGIGATRGEAHEMGPVRWIVMHDPDGNEFCLCQRDG